MIRLLTVLFFCVTIAGTAFVLGKSDDEGKVARRTPAVWGLLLFMTLFALAGAAWEEFSLRHFAQKEGGELRGLIMKPVPLKADHEFTRNGKVYLYKGIVLPALSTGLLLLLTAFGGTVFLHLRDLRSAVPAIWLHFVTALAAIVWFSVWRLLACVEIFI